MRARITESSAELWRYELPTPIGGSGTTVVDIVVVTMRDADGTDGMGWSYVMGGGGEPVCALARSMLARFVADQPAMAPQALWRRCAGSLNRLGRGAGYLALCAIDICAWDLHARAMDLPLGIAMGGAARTMPLYGSGGLWPFMAPDEAADRVRQYVARGIRGVKMRVAGTHADLARMAAVYDALPDNVHLMADANERCDLLRARWLAAACAEHEMLWLEEPLPAYDYAGFAQLAPTSPVAIATGEHLQGCAEFQPLFAAKGCALAQPDPAMMGGITECLRLATVAEHFGVVVAPHFNPALFIHVAAAAPAMQWLEDFPVLEPLFDDPPTWDKNGDFAMPTGPGHSIRFQPGVRERLQVAG
jgi:L-alanine-DL-glutamate epimerase-like enolase superfamily enzyme